MLTSFPEFTAALSTLNVRDNEAIEAVEAADIKTAVKIAAPSVSIEWGYREVRLLMLGLDGAGKTTVTNFLCLRTSPFLFKRRVVWRCVCEAI